MLHQTQMLFHFICFHLYVQENISNILSPSQITQPHLIGTLIPFFYMCQVNGCSKLLSGKY